MLGLKGGVARVSCRVFIVVLSMAIAQFCSGALAQLCHNYRRGTLHPGTAIRNPLLQPRVWIFDLIFDNFGVPFCFVFTRGKPSGPRNSILEGLTEFSASRQSSGAHL